MEVKPGCITGLVGQNGAGKTTTFKAMKTNSLFDLHAGLVEMLSFGTALAAVVLSCAVSYHIMEKKEF